MRTPQKGKRLRIFIDENDSFQGKPLSDYIVTQAREKGMAGATVLRGIMGYGAEQKIHSSKILRLSAHMPLIIEIVDTPEKISAFIPLLDECLIKGLITIEDVDVIKYRHDS